MERKNLFSCLNDEAGEDVARLKGDRDGGEFFLERGDGYAPVLVEDDKAPARRENVMRRASPKSGHGGVYWGVPAFSADRGMPVRS